MNIYRYGGELENAVITIFNIHFQKTEEEYLKIESECCFIGTNGRGNFHLRTEVYYKFNNSFNPTKEEIKQNTHHMHTHTSFSYSDTVHYI